MKVYLVREGGVPLGHGFLTKEEAYADAEMLVRELHREELEWLWLPEAPGQELLDLWNDEVLRMGVPESTVEIHTVDIIR